MASATTDLLIFKIVTILENEASSIAGVRDEIDGIKQELVSMKSFLHDADGKEAHTEGEETWVASVRDLAYDVEDIIDEFMYHIYYQQSGGRFARWLQKTIHIPKNVWFKCKIVNKLQKISQTIKAIPERNQRYVRDGRVEGPSTCDHVQKWVKNQAESSLFTKEDELVGIEDKKQILLGWLMNEDQKDQTVISVVGMGGLGKTTLVAKTFTNESVKRHFDCYAWITVSQTYAIEDLFRSLIKEFHQSRKDDVPGNLNAMSYRELLETLVNYLESKRYLVVLDDVWDIKLWREIRISLPDRQLGSVIMLTTRREDIASHSFGVKSNVYPIQPLEENQAKELFSRKAFSTYPNKCCPPEIEASIVWELVGRCKGLPLALEALGGLMSSKKSSAEWRRVNNTLNWHLTNSPLLEPVKSILLLSFNDLSYRLKHCFLYCSLFPEDYLIGKNRLIKLWMAEGFIEHVKGVTSEGVAETYLMELIFRSMLQVVRRNENGRPRTFKMHDLMRELALSTSEKEKYCAVYDGKEVMEEIGARRLSIQTREGEIKSCTGMSQLRSLLVFVNGKFSLPSGFKLLRVLDLEKAPIYKLPDELVYRYTGVYRGFRFIIGTKAPSNICNLKKLQVLACVESKGDIIRIVGNMTQLTRIGITNVKETDEQDLCASIQRMKLLYHLLLVVSDEEELLRINALSSPPPHLQNLMLAGKLERVPRWFRSLKSLTYMNLHWSRLEEDLLPHIEELPCLRSLILFKAYTGKELCFSRGFVNLVHLQLCNFPSLEKITIENGVMPNLQFLMLDSCMELKALPWGIEYLSNLKTLELGSVSMQLTESIQKGGVDHAKVQHLPDINDLVRTLFGRFDESKS